MDQVDAAKLARAVGELAPVLARIRVEILSEGNQSLTLRQYWLLLRVAEGCSSSGELRQEALVSRAAISQAVGILRRRGLIDLGNDDADSRRVSISITPSGAEALKEATQRLKDLDESMAVLLYASDGTPAERLEYCRAKIREALRTLSDSAAPNGQIGQRVIRKVMNDALAADNTASA